MADSTRIDPDDVSRIIMLAFGSMEQGGMYWCYVAVKPSRYDEFTRAMKSRQYNMQNFVGDGFGEVIVSGEGGLPPRDVTKQVAEIFGIPIKQLFASIDPMQAISRGVEAMKAKPDQG
ncbi:MAG: hypothetical protein KGJ06_02055 [Pseudomonadota bacterium]|nr:hypothetical protein [Pseudomonadota bacterium]